LCIAVAEKHETPDGAIRVEACFPIFSS
jgi:hypothetical protein